jgi:hypothetical protein
VCGVVVWLMAEKEVFFFSSISSVEETNDGRRLEIPKSLVMIGS